MGLRETPAPNGQRDTRALFEEWVDTRNASAREHLVSLHLPLVRHVARRFLGRGEALEDLVQVGCVGLLKAVDRFDPDRGCEFTSFAVPTIQGELKRHLRDRAWSVRPPRGLQELCLRLVEVEAQLLQELRRVPSVAELASAALIDEEAVRRALMAKRCYSSLSLNAPHGSDDSATEWIESLGGPDRRLELCDQSMSLQRAIAKLPERDRLILVLRFREELTQREIADQLGISQMHVSRLLARILERLRSALEVTTGGERGWR